MALRIHILGLGGVGKLIANCLPESPLAPSVTLLLHRAGLASQWRETGSFIDVITKGVSKKQSNLEVEEIDSPAKRDESFIQNLIVATKTHTTSAALKPLRKRLTADSTIVFLQNGMGTIDEVNESLFPIQSARPQCIAGVVNHGVVQTGPFTVNYTAPADMTLGLAPSQGKDIPTQAITPTSQLLLDCLINAPVLNAKVATQDHILFLQLQKLAVNGLINPLTTILACGNGELYSKLSKTTVIPELVAEIASVLQPFYLIATPGEVNSVLFEKLSAKSLEETIANAAIKTAANTSSMRQDMIAGKRTEIDYINGWIAARAAELGKDCHINQKIIDLVKRREQLSGEELARRVLDK